MIGTTKRMSDEAMKGFGFKSQMEGGPKTWISVELDITFWGTPTYKQFLATLTDKIRLEGVVQTRNAVKAALGL